MLEKIKVLDLKITNNNKEYQLYFNKHIISENILKYKLLYEKVESLGYYSNDINNNYYNDNRNIFFNTITYLYNNLLINYTESQLSYKTKLNKTFFNLTKYKPIELNFYHIHELFYKYNIFNNFDYNNDTILTIGTNLSFIEVIKFNNYKIKNIKNILKLK